MASIPLVFAQEDVEFGGKSGITSDFAYNNNVLQANIVVRMGFLRKVYSLLAVQLLLTAIVSAIFMFVAPVRQFVHDNDWLMMVAMVLSIGTLVALFIKQRESPTNLILLAAFTAVEAYSVGVIVTYYDQVLVLQALVLTVTVVMGLSAYTFQSKRDFSAMGFGLFTAVTCLMMLSIIQVFITSTTIELALSWFGAVLFCFFIIYDTQMLMQKLSPEEYIVATINLYLDIINLFIYILRILEASRRH